MPRSVISRPAGGFSPYLQGLNMNPLLNMVRLARPVNLLIIAATMYVLRFNVVAPLVDLHAHGSPPAFGHFPFFLAVLVMVLLAAAGNTINDYFDQKVDRINKPDRVIVGKSIKRRVAMILHQLFNGLAVVIGLYLGWRSQSYTVALIPIVVAAILWLYSPVLKKMFLLGNLAVTCCVMIVPVWTGLLETDAIWHAYADMLIRPHELTQQIWKWMLAYAVFAALLTLAREAQKDLEDTEGDTASGYRTMAVTWGADRTGRFIAMLLGITLLLAMAALVYVFGLSGWTTAVGTLCVLTPLVMSIIVTLKARSKQDYSRASRYTKLTMAGGLIFTFVIRSWLLSAG